MKKFVRSSALIACAVVGVSMASAAHADQIYYGSVMPVAYATPQYVAPVAYYGSYVAPTYVSYAAPMTTTYYNDGYGQYIAAPAVTPVAYYGTPYGSYGYVDAAWHY